MSGAKKERRCHVPGCKRPATHVHTSYTWIVDYKYLCKQHHESAQELGDDGFVPIETVDP